MDKKISYLLIFSLMILGCSVEPQMVLNEPVEIPSDWIEIEVGGIFTFYAPSDLQEVGGGGVDSFVTQYQSETIEVSIDYGWYSAEAICYPDSNFFIDCETEMVTLSGKDADILRANVRMDQDEEFFIAQLYVPRVVVEELDDGYEVADHLGMFVRSKDEELQDEILQIVKSVRFTDEFLEANG